MNMLKRWKLVMATLGLLPVVGVVSSCQDSMNDYYEEPSWIKGSIYEILEGEGRYQLFLQSVDRCEYKPLLQGRSILTVMVPDDDAMRSYLQEHYGTTDVAQIPLAELKKLIGFHILYYSLNADKLVNFRPNEGDGATEEQKEKNAGLYYKFRTRSQDAADQTQPARMMSEAGAVVDTTGVTVDVYHLERFIPVFSHKMFETKVIDGQYNYQYFFPSTSWNGQKAGSLGFNVADAEVQNQAEVIAKNGYIYYVDRVIKPLETIHTELVQNKEYSQYLALYDQYAYYDIDDELTNTYGGGSKTYYQRYYESNRFSLPNISREWPVSDYLQMTALASNSYSIFAPTNEAFNDFYMDYWGDEGTGYPNYVCYDSISADAVGYLLSNSIYRDLAFPEEIRKGEIQNTTTGTVISFDPDAVPQQNRRMCVNGLLYGQSVLTPPAVFGSVSGPAYKYKMYNLFLSMLGKSAMLSELYSDQVSYIVLYPNDAQYRANSIWLDSISGNIKFGPYGSTSATNFGSTSQAQYSKAHIINLNGANGELSKGQGTKVYRTFADNKLYIYVKDGRITNSYLYDNLIEYGGHQNPEEETIWADFDEILFRGNAWANGHCYAYDTENASLLLPGNLDNAIYANFVPMMFAHRNDEGTLFQGFIQLLILADLIDQTSATMNYQTESCLMLVPVTSAIKEAIVAGRMPHVTTTATSVEDPDFWSTLSVKEGELTALQHYLLEYFLPESTSPASEYPYLGWGQNTAESGGIPSIQDVEVTPAACVYVNIYDRGTKLTAQPGEGVEVDLYGGYDYLPFIYNDGCVQFLDGIFEDRWPNY